MVGDSSKDFPGSHQSWTKSGKSMQRSEFDVEEPGENRPDERLLKDRATCDIEELTWRCWRELWDSHKSAEAPGRSMHGRANFTWKPEQRKPHDRLLKGETIHFKIRGRQFMAMLR